MGEGPTNQCLNALKVLKGLDQQMFRIGVRLGLQNPGFRFFTVLSFTRDPRGGRERGGHQEPGLAPSSGLGDGVAPSGSGKEGYLKVAPAEFRDGNVCEGDLWTHGGRSPAATQDRPLSCARPGAVSRPEESLSSPLKEHLGRATPRPYQSLSAAITELPAAHQA